MATYTYPVPALSGTLTAQQVHLMLSNPRLIARRLASLVDQKFIADYLLQGRFEARGGGVFYESGESVFADDVAEAVEPGADYSQTTITRGDIVAAKTTKWGKDSKVSDEAIARMGLDPVNRSLQRLANTVIRQVDSVAMAVITSKLTDTIAATANWTTTKAVIASVLKARGDREALMTGVALDTVLLSGDDYATVMSLFLDSGLLPREGRNMILSGQLPAEILGFTWVTSPQFTGSNPLVLDRQNLGGMGDEEIGGPGYVRARRADGSQGVGVEVKVIRKDSQDAYKPRARRVTVPVVLDAHAGAAITGTGL